MQRYIAEYHQISPYGVVTAAAANARRGGLGPAGGGGSTASLRGRGRMEGRIAAGAAAAADAWRVSPQAAGRGRQWRRRERRHCRGADGWGLRLGRAFHNFIPGHLPSVLPPRLGRGLSAGLSCSPGRGFAPTLGEGPALEIGMAGAAGGGALSAWRGRLTHGRTGGFAGFAPLGGGPGKGAWGWLACGHGRAGALVRFPFGRVQENG